MRIVTILVSTATLAYLAITPAYAGQRGRPVVSAQPHDHPAPHGTPHADAHAPSFPPQLASRLQPLVPAGMTLQQAAAGFRNQGQFIAALHVSHNLNIPFAQLKAEMTGAHPESLGQAIHELRPAEDAKAAARRAEREARDDLEARRSDGDHGGHQ
jgi:hypothetical protein